MKPQTGKTTSMRRCIPQCIIGFRRNNKKKTDEDFIDGNFLDGNFTEGHFTDGLFDVIFDLFDVLRSCYHILHGEGLPPLLPLLLPLPPDLLHHGFAHCQQLVALPEIPRPDVVGCDLLGVGAREPAPLSVPQPLSLVPAWEF